MTDTRDITERLRFMAEWRFSDKHADDATLVSGAADTIDALRAEVARERERAERAEAEAAALRAAWRCAVTQADHDMVLTRDEIRHHYAAIDAARAREATR